MDDFRAVAVERLELRLAPRAWGFSDERRADIDAYFAAIKRAQPALWNGRVMLLYQWALVDGRFTGAYFDTDFASMIAWRDWGFPDPLVRNCFAQGALRSADGAFLLGVRARIPPMPARSTSHPVRPTWTTSSAMRSTSTAA